MIVIGNTYKMHDCKTYKMYDGTCRTIKKYDGNF